MNRVVFRLGAAIVWIAASILAVVSLLGEACFWRLLWRWSRASMREAGRWALECLKRRRHRWTHRTDSRTPQTRRYGADQPFARLWHRRLDDQWEFWINGHMEPQGGEEIAQKLAPGECYVKFNGWPAGLFSIITVNLTTILLPTLSTES